MTEEQECVETLEALGYNVDMPRKIGEYQACMKLNMIGTRYDELKGRFAQVAKRCGTETHGTKWREKYKTLLEGEIAMLTKEMKTLEYEPARPQLEKQLQQATRDLHRITPTE